MGYILGAFGNRPGYMGLSLVGMNWTTGTKPTHAAFTVTYIQLFLKYEVYLGTYSMKTHYDSCCVA
jgi:hypothetical protein